MRIASGAAGGVTESKSRDDERENGGSNHKHMEARLMKQRRVVQQCSVFAAYRTTPANSEAETMLGSGYSKASPS